MRAKSEMSKFLPDPVFRLLQLYETKYYSNAPTPMFRMKPRCKNSL